MNNQVKSPAETLVEKVGLENAVKWTVIVKQMIEAEKEEGKQNDETAIA